MKTKIGILASVMMLCVLLSTTFTSCKNDNSDKTIEKVLEQRREEIQRRNNEKLYFELPEVIVKAIYKKLGTKISLTDVVNEYQSNKSYYFDIAVKDQIDQADIETLKIGDDVLDKINVSTEIKTEQQEKEKASIEINTNKLIDTTTNNK